jgi:hypothetical protein
LTDRPDRDGLLGLSRLAWSCRFGAESGPTSRVLKSERQMIEGCPPLIVSVRRRERPLAAHLVVKQRPS